MSSSLVGDFPELPVKGRRGRRNNNNNNNNPAVVHHGRDLEPRDVSSDGRRLHHHHQQERPQSLSPVAATMRPSFARHHRSNTEPPELFGDFSEVEADLTAGSIDASGAAAAAVASPTTSSTTTPQQATAAAPTTTTTTTTTRSKSKRGGRKIQVAVRKRPVEEGSEDCVEVVRGKNEVRIGATKLRVDLTEYVESHVYEFDHVFSEASANEEVYETCVGRPLIDVVFQGVTATIFAFGQTGSGKTHSMLGAVDNPGVYVRAARDIFRRLSSTQRVFVSLYEIYCNSLFDLLNDRKVVIAREDGNKRVNVCGLTWHEVDSETSLMAVIDKGTDQRRTGSTSANEFSSRSHAIMSLTIRDDAAPKFVGQLNVVDLAGSERAADTSSNDRQTRLEGAEINKSLLALKECIRALDERKKHIPFRGSKLTEVLRDAFYSHSRTVLLATISPAAVNAEHTLNTLRYAFRVKGLTVDNMMPSNARKVENWAPPAIAMMKQQQAQQQQEQQQQQDGRESPADEIKSLRKGRAGGRVGRSGGAAARAVSESPPPPQQGGGGGGVSLPNINAVEHRMNVQIGQLRDDVRQLKESKARDDQKIAELSAMNRELLLRMDELVRLAASQQQQQQQQQHAPVQNRAPVMLPPMDSE